MANKAGSDGQIRKTTAQWATDTQTYPEGMRLMDTTTGVVRVSKGTTYALAWVPTGEGGDATWGGITGTLTDQTDLVNAINVKTRHHGPYTSGLTLRFLDTVTRENQLWQWDGGTTTSTNWATDSTNFGIAIAANLTAVEAAGPKVYAAIMNQSGTDAPVATVLKNTLGGTVVWTRDFAGGYYGTLAGAFPVAKTLILTPSPNTGAEIGNGTLRSVTRVSDNAILVDITDGGVPADDLLTNIGIKIEVYP